METKPERLELMTQPQPYQQTCPCDLCADPTINLGTKRCNRCWELERRIENDPMLTVLILSKNQENAEWRVHLQDGREKTITGTLSFAVAQFGDNADRIERVYE